MSQHFDSPFPLERVPLSPLSLPERERSNNFGNQFSLFLFDESSPNLNRTKNIALSLGAQADDSIGWASGLETPVLEKTRNSALEELTLLPKRNSLIKSPNTMEQISPSLTHEKVSPIDPNLCHELRSKSFSTQRFETRPEPDCDESIKNKSSPNEFRSLITSTPLGSQKSHKQRKRLTATFNSLENCSPSPCISQLRSNKKHSSKHFSKSRKCLSLDAVYNDQKDIGVSSNQESPTNERLRVNSSSSSPREVSFLDRHEENSSKNSKLTLNRFKKSKKFVYPKSDESFAELNKDKEVSTKNNSFVKTDLSTFAKIINGDSTVQSSLNVEESSLKETEEDLFAPGEQMTEQILSEMDLEDIDPPVKMNVPSASSKDSLDPSINSIDKENLHNHNSTSSAKRLHSSIERRTEYCTFKDSIKTTETKGDQSTDISETDIPSKLRSTEQYPAASNKLVDVNTNSLLKPQKLYETIDNVTSSHDEFPNNKSPKVIVGEDLSKNLASNGANLGDSLRRCQRNPIEQDLNCQNESPEEITRSNSRECLTPIFMKNSPCKSSNGSRSPVFSSLRIKRSNIKKRSLDYSHKNGEGPDEKRPFISKIESNHPKNLKYKPKETSPEKTSERIKATESSVEKLQILDDLSNCQRNLEKKINFCSPTAPQEILAEQPSLSIPISKNHNFKGCTTGLGNSESVDSRLPISTEPIRFSTGSGKAVPISEKSLAATKNIFSETDNISNGSRLASVGINFGFSTGSGKKVEVSDRALKIASKMLSEDNLKTFDIPAQSKIEKSKNNLTPKTPYIQEKQNLINNPIGFSTGSGKSVPISKKSLSAVKSIFNEKVENVIDTSHIAGAGISIGFSTGSGKKVKISDKALDIASKMLSEDNLKSFDNPLQPKIEKLEANYLQRTPYLKEQKIIDKPIDFRTYSEKLVSVSENSLAATKNILNKQEQNVISGSELPSIGINFGFSTGSGKKVVVSDKALEIASKMLSEDNLRVVDIPTSPNVAKIIPKTLDRQEINNQRLRSNNSPSELLEQTNIFFQTGLGKVIRPDPKSIAAAKKKLDSDNLSPVSSDREVPEIQPSDVKSKSSSTNSQNKITANNFTSEELLEVKKVTEAFLLDSSWHFLTQCSSNSKGEISRTNSEKEASERNHEAIESERDILRNRQEIISKRKTNKKVANHHGSLFQLKNQKDLPRVPLQNIFPLKTKWAEEESEYICINPQNATEFRFNIADKSAIDIQLDDKCQIVPGSDNKVGVSESQMGFTSSPDVDSSLVPEGWVANHYKWIIWKLASYQRKAPEKFRHKALSLKETMKQLKYRYDIEIIEGKRSVLRKIYEQDDAPQKSMVLCVSSLKDQPNLQGNASASLLTLELTDGWYSIEAQIDKAMMNLVRRKVVRVGTKILIHGAELMGNPSPCHPLESCSSGIIQLRIHTNMCRLCEPTKRLGLSFPCGFLPSTLISCVLEDGGLVGTLDLKLVRKYEPIYIERTQSDRSIVRNCRSHERKVRELQAMREIALEEVYSQALKEMDLGCGISQNDKNSICIENQRNAIEAKVQEKIQDIDKKYDVSCLLKLGVADRRGTPADLSIWRPQDDLISALKEGQWYRFNYLLASQSRTGINHFTWRSHSKIKEIKEITLENDSLNRRITSLEDLLCIKIDDPWMEVNFVGLVSKVSEVTDNKQVVFLSDHLTNIIGLNFFPSIEAFGFCKLFRVGELLSVCNASWKGKSSMWYPSLHVTAHTIVSSTPSNPDMKRALVALKNEIKDATVTIDAVESKLNNESVSLNSPLPTLSPVFSSRFPESSQSSRNSRRSLDIKKKIQGIDKIYNPHSPINSLKTYSSPLASKPFKSPLTCHLKFPKNET